MNRWELEKKIVMKALKDPEFKKKLTSHPKEALREMFKKDAKDLAYLEKINIRTHEEKKDEWMISLPNIGVEGKKLTDAELEKLLAAGGSGYSIAVTC